MPVLELKFMKINNGAWRSINFGRQTYQRRLYLTLFNGSRKQCRPPRNHIFPSDAIILLAYNDID